MSMKAASLKITGRRHLNPSHDLQFGRNQLINWCWTKNYSQIFEIRIDIQLTLDFLRAYDNTKLWVLEAFWRDLQLAFPPRSPTLRPTHAHVLTSFILNFKADFKLQEMRFAWTPIFCAQYICWRSISLFQLFQQHRL